MNGYDSSLRSLGNFQLFDQSLNFSIPLVIFYCVKIGRSVSVVHTGRLSEDSSLDVLLPIG